ncbi:MAG: hypothetical protein ACSLE1_22115 [Sphingobium sp.]
MVLDDPARELLDLVSIGGRRAIAGQDYEVVQCRAALADEDPPDIAPDFALLARVGVGVEHIRPLAAIGIIGDIGPVAEHGPDSIAIDSGVMLAGSAALGLPFGLLSPGLGLGLLPLDRGQAAFEPWMMSGATASCRLGRIE